MTIQIPAVAAPRVITAYHHKEGDVQGYRVNIGAESVFITESDADKLARYMLFKDEVA